MRRRLTMAVLAVAVMALAGEARAQVRVEVDGREVELPAADLTFEATAWDGTAVNVTMTYNGDPDHPEWVSPIFPAIRPHLRYGDTMRIAMRPNIHRDDDHLGVLAWYKGGVHARSIGFDLPSNPNRLQEDPFRFRGPMWTISGP